jgi:hypothetical protein
MTTGHLAGDNETDEHNNNNKDSSPRAEHGAMRRN